MAKPKRPGVPSTAPAAPATAKVPAPAPVKPAGGAAAGGAAPRKAAPSGGAPRNVPPPREEEDMFAGSSITLEPDEAEITDLTPQEYSRMAMGIDPRQTRAAAAGGARPKPAAYSSSRAVDPAVAQALIVARQARQLGRSLGSAQAKMSPEELETAELKPYIERLQKVGELRAKGEIGEKPWYARRKLGLIPSDQVVRLGPLSIPIPDEETARDRYFSGDTSAVARAGGESLYPRKITSPSVDELSTPIKGARAAKQLADQYRQALGEYETARVSVQEARDNPYVSRQYLPTFTAQAQDKLQRVIDLKASMREYGWSEEDLKSLE